MVLGDIWCRFPRMECLLLTDDVTKQLLNRLAVVVYAKRFAVSEKITEFEFLSINKGDSCTTL